MCDCDDLSRLQEGGLCTYSLGNSDNSCGLPKRSIRPDESLVFHGCCPRQAGMAHVSRISTWERLCVVASFLDP